MVEETVIVSFNVLNTDIEVDDIVGSMEDIFILNDEVGTEDGKVMLDEDGAMKVGVDTSVLLTFSGNTAEDSKNGVE